MSNKIICQRTFTYDVEEVKNSIRDINNDPTLDVSLEEVWDLVYDWAIEDMASPATHHDLTFVDEDNEEIGL